MTNKIFCLLIFCTLRGSLPAQAPALTLFPDPQRIQCPNVNINYYIMPWSASCPAWVTATGGEVVRQDFYNDRLEVTIIWQVPVDSTPALLELHWADSLCNYGVASRSWSIPILAPALSRPTISGTNHAYYMGQSNAFDLSAHMEPYVDPNSGIILPFYFEWEAPDDWYVYGYGLSSEKTVYISYTTLSEGCVRVRAKHPCGFWSDWAEYCFEGTIPPPCPIRLNSTYIVCGDTSEHLIVAKETVFPELPQLYDWSPPEYSWTAPPGWKMVSTNPTTKSRAIFQPDGHTNGLITAVATGGEFTSDVCEYNVTFLAADPGTRVAGPDFLCSAGSFALSPSPPSASALSWQIIPLDPTTPPVIFPDHGEGEAVVQVLDPSLGGFFRITYTLTNVCGSAQFSKDFFVGKPIFYQTTLDGVPYTAQPLCVGYHGTKTSVYGKDEQPVRWSASAGLTGFTQRDSFIFTLPADPAVACPVITASAVNSCGTADLPLEICTRPGCVLPPLDLQLYPNPADIIVTLETISADSVAGDYGLIGSVEIFNSVGQLVTTWQESPTHRLIKPIVDLPNGLYTLRVRVWDQIVLKRLMIVRLF